ncbi:Factor arrest protein 11 [Entomortierella chlamydospora]|uniref:Factor arrest protein 11 n=1 Tax=Entomortierella chlamydospora TaxID=101097 RepID=A0A9P6T239_9FUNG|nr:Factor arrest protein 11 [Entomortierella chlamydospora]KAG0018990.1 Factor arrest protein 11 [Entomortierella chlamydospora]
MADNPTQDSITMAQLKQFVSTLPANKKLEPVHFQYADMDTVSAEIDEFFSYSEVQQFLDNQENFHKNYDGDWQKSTRSEREAYAEYLLDFLDQTGDSSRISVIQQLIYISQGAYAGVSNEDDHLDWIIKNNQMLRKLGAFQTYYDALRNACSKLTNEPSIAVEIDALLTLLYMLVISHEDDFEFMSELAATNPSMTVFLYDQICVRPAKDQFYPLKKMLLLLWKVLRTTLGGTDDFPILKNISRRMMGNPPINPANFTQKSDPIDYLVYQSEMSQKYPAYIPSNSGRCAACPSTPISTIASVLQAKVATASGSAANGSQISKLNGTGSTGKAGKGSANGSGGNAGTQPFIFPSSSMRSSTPKSITEAEELFKKNMYISAATLQIYQEKKLMTERRYQSNNDAEDQSYGRALEYKQPPSIRNKIRPRRRSLMRRVSGNGNQGDDEADDTTDEEDESDEDKRRQGDSPTAPGSEVLPVSDMERERIERIEHIYREIVPRMAQIQVTLLKTLLVCIKISGATSAKDAPNAEPESKEPVDTFTRVNDIREHEIMAKAVSSILLLQLQHFKIYHVLAFNYVCQLLVDSNCLLLLLKIFGNAENPGNIHTKNEMEEYNFFKTCSIIRQTRSESNPERARLAILKGAVADIGDPLPANYVCRRNMFAIINLLRVLQKLTKEKTHRILLLVQYKSSAILKRLLKINHPDLQKYVYKALKSQVPFLGRKWRSSHMKVITGIYIYCRSNLRDDWISGADVEKDLEDALPAEQQLRNMIRHYHDRVHPNALIADPGAQAKGGKNGTNQYSGPKYDWQEMYEAHASIPEVGAFDYLHHQSQGSNGSLASSGAKSEGEESVRSTNSYHSSRSHTGSSSGRRDLTMSDIELDAGFEENYEEWLEAEVFGKKNSTALLEPPNFKYNDFYFDETTDVPFLRDSVDGTGWDTPAVMPSDDDEYYFGGKNNGGGSGGGDSLGAFNFSRWEDEELFKQINWTPDLHSTDASVEQQYYLDEVSEFSNSNVYYNYDYADGTVDADTGIDIATSGGVNGSGSNGGRDIRGPGMRRRSQPLRVRKSEGGTEWIEDEVKEEVIHAYGPSPATHMLDQAEFNE